MLPAIAVLLGVTTLLVDERRGGSERLEARAPQSEKERPEHADARAEHEAVDEAVGRPFVLQRHVLLQEGLFPGVVSEQVAQDDGGDRGQHEHGELPRDGPRERPGGW